MDNDNLVRMANRIGDFFEAMPDEQEALEGIALHLRKFWDPRMRRQMLAQVEQVEQGGAQGLHPLVAKALEQKRHALL
jgi:formate dehydrogenase subunit delta